MLKSGYGDTIRREAPYAVNSNELTAAIPRSGDICTGQCPVASEAFNGRRAPFLESVTTLQVLAQVTFIQRQGTFILHSLGQNVKRVFILASWRCLRSLYH